MANLINRRAGGRLLRGVLNESSELNESNEYLIKQVGGYFEEYATDGPPLTFLTVKGAGHMVPTFKPRFALTMLTKFLAGEAF